MSRRQLLLVRHAKAAWEQGATTDFDRPLTPAGQRHADALASWLKDRVPRPTAIVSSPAPRAYATAKRLATAWLDAPEITIEPDLYEAPLGGPMRLIHSFPDTWTHVLIVGHNPSLSHTADWLLGEPTVLDLPPGGLAWLEVDARRWLDIGPGEATLRFLRVLDSVVSSQ
jgi:phosphohistidine phosphatase